jgi:hypothetical protein
MVKNSAKSWLWQIGHDENKLDMHMTPAFANSGDFFGGVAIGTATLESIPRYLMVLLEFSYDRRDDERSLDEVEKSIT